MPLSRGQFSIAAVCLLIANLTASAQAPEGDPSIVSPDARLEMLFDGAFFTEGPTVAFDGSVYFSDITFTHSSDMQAGHIWRYAPATGETRVYRSPSGMSNGLKIDAQGRLIAAEGADYGGRRLTRTDLETGKSEIIAGLFEGRPFNSPNDITIDEQGRIYFSDPRYLGHEPVDQPVMAVYRIDPDGTVERVITDAGKPNGVCISPDQKSLYVVSNDNGNGGIGRMGDDTPAYKGRMALLAYDLNEEGHAAFRSVLVDYAPQDGPDGLVVDAEGNLYVAVRDTTRYGINVYAPDGRELARIPTPGVPTNVAFGRGTASKTLYVTYDNALARIQVEKEGYHLPDPE
ncbi:MAG: SMP-30/gluconolactonase/LRE family protein [Candidatus Latescibacteria bacterium]|nr:SMP-30/gluconolactonase/LRE family protein [Candidatus Latescibacterota bacterium]